MKNHYRVLIAGVALAVAGATFLCEFNGPTEQATLSSSGERTYKIGPHTIPLNNLEVVQNGEDKAIEWLAETSRQYFAIEYGKPSVDSATGMPIEGTRRGVHPKAHGCMTGTFSVDKDLDNVDRVGIFQPGASYPTTIRFSNAGPRQNNKDTEADSRGIAFKVFNPPSSAVIPQEGETSQDFTLNSTDQFFTANGPSYARFMDTALLKSKDSGEAARNYVALEFKSGNYSLARRSLVAFAKMALQKPSNPLALEYFSISPFQHGRGQDAPGVKYRMLPCEGTWKEERNEEDPHFLRHALQKHINSKPACFNFYVQHRTKNNQPVEDISVPWKEKDAPFKKIARLEIPQQEFMDERICEKLVISPWNTIEEHKPVGGINRIRLAAYLFSSESRKKTNH